MGNCMICDDLCSWTCHGCDRSVCTDCKTSHDECPECGQWTDWG